MQTGSKTKCYIPLPLGITPSSVFHYIYTIHIQLHIKISKFCRSVPRSTIYSERSHVPPFTLNAQDQALRLPQTSLAGSQLSAYPEAWDLCDYCPHHVPSLGSPGVNYVLHISNILLVTSSLLYQFPLSLHA